MGGWVVVKTKNKSIAQVNSWLSWPSPDLHLTWTWAQQLLMTDWLCLVHPHEQEVEHGQSPVPLTFHLEGNNRKLWPWWPLSIASLCLLHLGIFGAFIFGSDRSTCSQKRFFIQWIGPGAWPLNLAIPICTYTRTVSTQINQGRFLGFFTDHTHPAVLIQSYL